MPFFDDANEYTVLFNTPTVTPVYDNHLREDYLNDIIKNLTKWAYNRDCIFYRTNNYWYVFQVNMTENIVNMTRYDSLKTRTDDWCGMNTATVVGRNWLMTKHKDKRVELFEDKVNG